MAEAFVDLYDAAEFTASIKMTPSNSNYIAPLSISAEADIKSLKSSDTVSRIEWWLNGERIEGDRRYVRIADLAAGLYELKVLGYTEWGSEIEHYELIEVKENMLPTCRIDATRRGQELWIESACKDIDGHIIGYEWFVNEEQVGSYGPTLRLENLKQLGLNIELIVTDDTLNKAHYTIYEGASGKE